MTTKDYELIADILSTIKDDSVRFDLIRIFSRKLKEINPRFNMVKFARACTPGANRERIV